MAASNTHDCFRAFIGQRCVGVMFDALPVNRRDIASGTKTLVFEDGRGLTVAANGSYWIESAEDVGRAVSQRREDLARMQLDLVEVLSLAGALKRLPAEVAGE